jgi:hypothetical protein
MEAEAVTGETKLTQIMLLKQAQKGPLVSLTRYYGKRLPIIALHTCLATNKKGPEPIAKQAPLRRIDFQNGWIWWR